MNGSLMRRVNEYRHVRYSDIKEIEFPMTPKSPSAQPQKITQILKCTVKNKLIVKEVEVEVDTSDSVNQVTHNSQKSKLTLTGREYCSDHERIRALVEFRHQSYHTPKKYKLVNLNNNSKLAAQLGKRDKDGKVTGPAGTQLTTSTVIGP